MKSTNKLLIIKPKYGLCNQITSIVKGIILAHISKRDIYIDKFQIDYNNSENRIELSEIFNLKKLYQIIKFLKLNVTIIHKLILDNRNIVNNININEYNNCTDGNIKEHNYKINFISYLENNEKEDILDIGDTISSIIPESYTQIYENFKINIPFHITYIQSSIKVKECFQLQNYICIHLRLEDDCFKFMNALIYNNIEQEEIVNTYKRIYEDELENIKKYNVKIYVCTSLCIYPNSLNEYYQNLKKKYNLIDKNDLINSFIFDNKNNSRELYGIIDFIIAKDSNYFIGCDWSSFSILLYNTHKFYNKSPKLLNLWKSCKINNEKI